MEFDRGEERHSSDSRTLLAMADLDGRQVNPQRKCGEPTMRSSRGRGELGLQLIVDKKAPLTKALAEEGQQKRTTTSGKAIGIGDDTADENISCKEHEGGEGENHASNA